MVLLWGKSFFLNYSGEKVVHIYSLFPPQPISQRHVGFCYTKCFERDILEQTLQIITSIYSGIFPYSWKETFKFAHNACPFRIINTHIDTNPLIYGFFLVTFFIESLSL